MKVGKNTNTLRDAGAASVIRRSRGLKRVRRRIVLPLSWLLTLTGCVGATEVSAPTSERFAKTEVCILGEGSVRTLEVELAVTPAQRAQGLMDRSRLAPASGMLFLYPDQQSSFSGFWMYRTAIPLDVAFLARDGGIVRIESMSPCLDRPARDCPVYRAGQPFWAALEVNQGFFSTMGVGQGDRVVRAGQQGCGRD